MSETAVIDDDSHPDLAPHESPRRAQRLRPVDFSQPTKFTSEHQRRMSRSLETFCQTASTRLSAELRTTVELELANSMQLAWSGVQAQLPQGSLAVTLAASPVDTRMLLTVELGFVLTALECLLGGMAQSPPRERRLTEIDWALTRRLVESITVSMSAVWHDLVGLELVAADIDLHNEASQIASVSEPTFAQFIDVRINGHVTTLALLVPWLAIDPVADLLAGRDANATADSPEALAAIQSALSAAEVTLRAEVASVELAVDEILALAPGDLLRLGARAESGVSLYIEDRPLAQGQPGRSGARRAVRITHRTGNL